MPAGRIIFYDFEHCQHFIGQRARDLNAQAHGLESLALFRELFYAFSYEALEQNAVTIGQFDSGVIYVFTPGELARSFAPEDLESVRAKAVELLGSNQPPLVIELLSGQTSLPLLSAHGRMENWMRDEFLEEVILSRHVMIQLYFDGGSFFNDVMDVQLNHNGFDLIDSYAHSAREGTLRVRHNGAPGKIFKLPWVAWVREMMGGGFGMVYPMACFATYLQKLQSAVSVGPRA